MSEAEPLIGANRHESISRRCDNHRLRQPGPERRRYRERLSTVGPLAVKVPVVVFSEIVTPTFKQPDNLMAGMAGDIYTDGFSAGLSLRLRDSLRRYLRFGHSQLNSLFVFEADFAEGLENSVFIKRVEGF